MTTKKSALWFSHESTSGKGLRLRKLTRIYGHWGKGVYWDICEFLLEQDQFSFVCDETSLQVVSEMIGCNDELKFISWYNDCVKLNLLQTDGIVFWNETLIDRLGKLITSRTNGGKGGRPTGTKNKPKDNLTETQDKPNDNLTITKQEPNDNQSETQNNHTNTNTNTNTNTEREREKNLSIKISMLAAQKNLEAAAMKNNTSVENILKSFNDFWHTNDYDTNDNNQTESEIRVHFNRWLNKNKPPQIKFVDEWGEYGEDYYCAFFGEKTEPEKYKEAIEAGFVKYSDTELRFKIIKNKAQ